jgi:glycosyltransferase involved in cell wall biosynthesis
MFDQVNQQALSTSRYESFGLAALEALCSGMAVISKRIPSMSFCNGKEDGFFCYSTIDEAIRIMVDLLSDNELLSKSQVSASEAGLRYCQREDLFLEVSLCLAFSKR